MEVNIGASHLAVVLAARPSRHEAIAEVDETAKGDERKEYGLLYAHTVCTARFFLKYTAFTHVGSEAHVRLFEEDGPVEISAF